MREEIRQAIKICLEKLANEKEGDFMEGRKIPEESIEYLATKYEARGGGSGEGLDGARIESICRCYHLGYNDGYGV